MPTSALFDMSQAQPIQQASGPPLFDMSKAQSLDSSGTPQSDGAPIQKVTRSTNPKLNIAASGENMPEYVGATGAIGAGLMAGELAAPAIGPIRGMISKQMAKHPILGPTVASYLISKAREIPWIGEKIPPNAELMPFLAGKGAGDEPAPTYPGASEPTAPPEVLQAAPLSRGGGKPVSSPSDALGNVPVKTEPAKLPAAFEPAPAPYKPPAGTADNPMRGQIAKQMGPSKKLPAAFEPRGPQYQSPTGTADNPSNISNPMRAPDAAPQQPPIQRGSLQELLQQSLGGKELQPNVPLRNQVPARGSIAQQMKSPIAETPAAEQSGSTSIPEGHTAVDSSALRSYKYDPAANEMHANYKGSDNIVHVFGDMSPEEAQAFEQAPSKGQAMQAVKNSHPLVGKIVDGKRIAVKATSSQ